jgi:putative DNA primase/helicase
MEAEIARYHACRAEFLKQFISSAYLPRPEKKEDEVLVNFENGTFVITPESQFLRAFDHRDFLTYQLPFSYDPSSDAPIFEEYLQRVLPDGKKQMVLAEFIAYVFVRQNVPSFIG